MRTLDQIKCWTSDGALFPFTKYIEQRGQTTNLPDFRGFVGGWEGSIGGVELGVGEGVGAEGGEDSLSDQTLDIWQSNFSIDLKVPWQKKLIH